MSKETKIGLLATTALVVAYLGLNFLKGQEVFSSKNVYHTTYINTGGLNTSSPVLVNGMLAGRVRNLRILPDQGYRVLVTFETDKNIVLTNATEARLVSHNLFGGRAIELIIKEGDSIKNYTTIPGQVEQGFAEVFAEKAFPIMSEAGDISILASQFMTSLVGNIDKINSIFSDLEETTQKLKQTVVANQQGIHQIGKNLAVLSDVLSDSSNGVGPLLTKLNQLIEGLEGKEARMAMTKLNSILLSIENVMLNVQKKDNNLQRLLYDDTFYTNLNNTLADLDQLLVDLKLHPWRYMNFSVFGKKNSHRE